MPQLLVSRDAAERTGPALRQLRQDNPGTFTEGLVVTDTNVLLNLYRYNPEAREGFVDVLERLGERLWIPHQVMLEFWRNREAALRDPQKTASEIADALDDQQEKPETYSGDGQIERRFLTTS